MTDTDWTDERISALLSESEADKPVGTILDVYLHKRMERRELQFRAAIRALLAENERLASELDDLRRSATDEAMMTCHPWSGIQM